LVRAQRIGTIRLLVVRFRRVQHAAGEAGDVEIQRAGFRVDAEDDLLLIVLIERVDKDTDVRALVQRELPT
jgi:hypothetical protein